MKLLTLTLRNFQGVRDFTLDCQGKNVTVYGDNGAGKTTLASAWSWLLFDKDSLNRKDFEIKTLTQDGEPIHGLEHEVEATIDLDGEQLTLKKVYTEKWTKQRGSAEAVFSGHTTKHYIDGVPCATKRQYEDKIAEFADEKVFRLLTDPRAFNETLHWADRRKILLQVCGDVTDEDVINSDPALADLPEILGKRTLDQHKAMVKEQRTKVNKEREGIKTRISEARYGLPDISLIDPEVLESDLAKARQALEGKQAEKLRVEQGGEIAEKQKQLAQVEAEMFRVEGIHRREQLELTEEARNKLYAVKSARRELELDIKGLEKDQQRLNQGIREAHLSLEVLREKWAKIDSEAFEHEANDTCPTCGQAIPEEQLQEAYEKALDAFNLDKAQRLESITAQGKQKKAEAEKLESEFAELQERIAESKAILADLLAEEQKLQEEVDSKPPQPVDLNPEYAKLVREKEHLEDAIFELKDRVADVLGNINDEIETYQLAVQAYEEAQDKLKAHAQAEARVKELKAQERRLSREHEQLQRQQDLCDEFTRAKVRLLDEKINSRFKLARFKLFEEQINGGIADTCITLCDGVPWDGGLNNGSQINVGIDIINTLSKHYGFVAPIFIDNAESVTEIIPTPAQLIRLVVSAGDKKLRVEKEENHD
jgi:DNA repair exonuclease SbcCD ATPase subunit